MRTQMVFAGITFAISKDLGPLSLLSSSSPLPVKQWLLQAVYVYSGGGDEKRWEMRRLDYTSLQTNLVERAPS